MTVRLLKHIYFRLPILVRLLLLVLILMCFFGALIHYIEPSQFPTIFDGIWWAFVTAATVGYGDFVPLSVTGRIIAILLILTGGGFIAFYITSISTTTLEREKKLETGKLEYKGSGHLIIIGWNERAKQLINLLNEKFPEHPIVLIDRTLRKISITDYPVHFIHGDATEDHILTMANISGADRVLITADVSKTEKQADIWTILATLAIRGNNNNIPIVAEILTKIQVENAVRAGATTILRPNDFLSVLFFHELSHEKTATPFEDIIAILKRKQFSHKKVPKELEEMPFREVSDLLLKQGHLLFGIKRDDSYKVFPPASYVLKKDDILLTFIDW